MTVGRTDKGEALPGEVSWGKYYVQVLKYRGFLDDIKVVTSFRKRVNGPERGVSRLAPNPLESSHGQ